MTINNNLRNAQPEAILEDKISFEKYSSQPIRQTIVPYRRYDGRLIRLVYDVYRYDQNSEIYHLRFNEDLLDNYK